MNRSEFDLVQIAPVIAGDVEPRRQATLYPLPFSARMIGRQKRTLGDQFGLKAFGVNLTTLQPGAQSALKHRHSIQDEFIYVVTGTLSLETEGGEFELSAGMCAGFPAMGTSHHLINRGSSIASYLEVGDRAVGDEVFYPDDDLQVRTGPDGRRRFEHKDGRPY